MRQSYIHMRTVLITVVITTVIMMVLLYAPSPFVVLKPGIAVPATSYIKTNESNKLTNIWDTAEGETLSDEGELLLTAVLLTTPNLWEMLGSLVSPKDDIRLKANVLGSSSMEEYATRVTSMMQGSHDNALEAAYRYLNISYTIQPQQLIIQQPAACLFDCDAIKAGDEIVAGVSSGQKKSIVSVEQLHDWLAEQLNEQDDDQQLTDGQQSPYLIIKRNESTIHLPVQIKAEDWKAHKAEERVYELLKIDSFIELRAVKPDDPDYEVEIAIDNIGGPSAGLVLALTVVDQLTLGDLTKGKTIAATGTIDAKGNVGSIGGIVQKVYSTSEQGAYAFIVPKGNEAEALQAMKKIDSGMKIIAVATLEEAVEALASL